MTNKDDEFSWGALGQAWFRENGAACRATETQIRYAACRHQGANKSAAATMAGYKGSPEALRSAGVRAEGTKAVDDLLTLAATADSGGPDQSRDARIERKIDKLIDSPDGALALKAIEAHAKREENRRQRGETPSDDGFSSWRIERDLISLQSGAGASAYLHMIGGAIANLCLLHDTRAVLMREPDGPELWAKFYARLNDAAREALDKAMADPGYQLEARRKIWAEIGQQPPGPVAADAIDMLKRDPRPESVAEAAANASA